MRIAYLIAFLLFVVVAGCERESVKNKWGIDPDELVAKNPALSLMHDNVRIRVTPSTEAAGVAGRIGNVAGFTTPSMTGVEVIGEVKEDLAFSVMFENPHMQLWFAPDLLEFVDHAPGLKIEIGKTKLTRRADGSWDKVSK